MMTSVMIFTCRYYIPITCTIAKHMVLSQSPGLRKKCLSIATKQGSSGWTPAIATHFGFGFPERLLVHTADYKDTLATVPSLRFSGFVLDVFVFLVTT